MIKAIIQSLLALSLVLISAPAEAPSPPPIPIIKHNSIIRIVYYNEYYKQNKTLCSGVVISDHLALTSAHCLGSPLYLLRVSNQYKTEYQEFEVLGLDMRRDIALLKGHFKQYERMYLPSGETGLEEHQGPWQSCGFPHGGKLVCSKAIISSNQYHDVKMKALIFPAMSGGPVFNPATNMLVCINKFTMAGASGCASVVNILEDLGLIPEE